MNTIDLRQRIRDLVEAGIHSLGFDLVAVEWTGNAHGSILRLSIEKSGGISARDCAAVTDYVSPLLDEDDPISSAYRLEVSSPGISRPVQRREDFLRFVGYRIKIRLVEGHPRRRYSGRVVDLEGDELSVDVDGHTHTILLDTIETANLVMDLDEYQQLAEVRDNDDQ